jgi:hypothetical protein
MLAVAMADEALLPRIEERQPTPSLVVPNKPAWMEPVERQLFDIVGLPFGWDAFGAGPVRRDVVWFALSLFDSAMLDDTPPPHIAPMSHEGIMLEWHRDDVDLEIEIERPGEAHISYEDHVAGAERSWTITTNVNSLAAPIARLTA